ncbi:MAG TPA: hypothetical protein PLK12_17045, partial [Prolixibacteraceae bacterium]|nr:hypothetical protein [Prolixibacteraceae bacterium]
SLKSENRAKTIPPLPLRRDRNTFCFPNKTETNLADFSHKKKNVVWNIVERLFPEIILTGFCPQNQKKGKAKPLLLLNIEDKLFYSFLCGSGYVKVF